MDDILKGLNAAQRAAVTSSASVLQVLAPPGSGKTKTLTTRVAYLIAQQHLKPWNIIVCTFTVKAANEMKERIKDFIGDELAKQLKLGTFHSVALRYLKSYGQHIGLDKDFGIADSADSIAIVKRIVKQNDFTINPNQARSRISAIKAKGIDSEQFMRTAKNVDQQEFGQVYQQYQETLKTSNLLDYDDLLIKCCFLLREHPQCVSNVQALLIDEFQDTNNIQYDLMSLFAQQQNVITIVGDPDQSIYGFRSAEIKNLTRMRDQWPDTITINLEENYRSSGAILHAAQHIIEQDESRPPKRLQATHSLGLRPVLRKLPSAAAEADWLVSEVKRMQAMSGDLLLPSDFAVLLRSASLSRAIESALGRAGVPYRMVGGIRFYDRVEVKLLVDYLRVISQPDNSEAVERIINTPSRRIGDATTAGLQQEAQNKGRTLWSLILDISQGRARASTKLSEPAKKGLASFVNIILSGRKKMVTSETEQPSLVDLLNFVLQKLSFQQYLKQKYPEEFEARWTNVEELIAQATDASDPERLQAMLEENALPNVDGFERREADAAADMLSLFLSNIALTAASAEKAAKDGDIVHQLTISTIHAAKGLEWPVVFVPACYDGSIPHSRADDNDEERRLLYVGMTRAQALLYLSCPMKNTQREETSMSTFLQQPGVSAFFEEHGPSISPKSVTDLAATLRRDCPSAEKIERTKRTIERDEDNYWPLNGEQPLEELAKWDHGKAGSTMNSFGTARPAAGFVSASTTMQQSAGFSAASTTLKPGFSSVASRFDELMEQARLDKVDKRSKETTATDKPRGQKRQGEAKASIASFFKKPCTESAETQAYTRPTMGSVGDRFKPAKAPLDDITNLGSSRSGEQADVFKPSSLERYKPRTAPLKSRPTGASRSEDPAPNKDYLFLSSSPPRPEDQETTKPEEATAEPVSRNNELPEARARPAATFHTTSMQKVAPQRRTLGTRRSLHGWKPKAA